MKAAVIVFPGSNCDRDCKVAIERSTGATVDMVWHQETALPTGVDLVVLPGGFAHGDYLRCGAMAARSPVMTDVAAAAKRGVATVGICNGFQVLCEAGMLPGALLRNTGMKYVCKAVDLDIVNAQTRFTAAYGGQRTATLTIGNGEGNYFADEDTLDRLEGEGSGGIPLPREPERVVSQYRRHHRQLTERAGIDAPPRPRLRGRPRLAGWRRAIPERARERLNASARYNPYVPRRSIASRNRNSVHFKGNAAGAPRECENQRAAVVVVTAAGVAAAMLHLASDFASSGLNSP